ncbi:MAG: DUF6639 family protein, partial [Sedimenticolaceae bacterium]
MVFFHTALAWVSLTLLSFLAAAGGADSTNLPIVHSCPNTSISVLAESRIDYAEICAGAEDGIAFFGRLPLEPIDSVLVEIVQVLPEEAGDTAVGCYLEDDQRILVLDFAKFAKQKTWFNVPIDQSMYRSLVTHEVAHAVAACNMAMPESPIQAKEYLAYVAMFAMMDQRLRGQILDANPCKAFDRESKINATIYLCDPMRFAVRAYRHYLGKKNGDEFLLKIMSG